MPFSQVVTLLGTMTLVGVVASRKRPSWNLGFLTLFSIVWIGIAGYYQSGTEQVAKTALLHGQTGGSIYYGDMGGAWTIFALFIIGVLLGTVLVNLHRKTLRTISSDTSAELVEANSDRVKMTLAASTLISIGLLGFAMTKNGYPTNREQMSLLLSFVPDGGTLIGEALIRVAIQGPCFAVLLIQLSKPTLVKTSATWLSLGLWLLWSNPVITARYWSFGTLVAFALMYMVARRKKSIARWANLAVVLFLPVIAIVIFPLLDRFRTDSSTSSDGFRGLEKTLISDPDFDAFAQTGNAVAVVEGNGLTNGVQLLSPFSVAIPRSIWPGKPLGGGEYVSNALGTEHPNVALPLPAELYLDFGLSGALIAGVACGLVVEYLDTFLDTSQRTTRRMALAIGFTPFWLIILRGALLPVSYRMVPLLLIFLFLTPTPNKVKSPLSKTERLHRYRPQGLEL